MTFVARCFGRAHLVHPRAAVPPIAAENETSLRVHPDSIVEPVIGHDAVQLLTSVVFAEGQSAEVSVDGGLDD